jgi:hypothetical protein
MAEGKEVGAEGVEIELDGTLPEQPFDYDLFRTDQVTTRQVVQSEDSWSLTAP